jgi:hypothetical protein
MSDEPVTDSNNTRTSGDDESWVTIERDPYRLIPYGSEAIDGVDVFSSPCNVCEAVPGANHTEACVLGYGRPYVRPTTCRDCGVPIGALHIRNCGIEQCPRCAGQYASCACNSSEDAPEDEE